MQISDYADIQTIEALIATARIEDIGPADRDVTSDLLIAPDHMATAEINSRRAGVLSGAALLPMIAAAYDDAITLADVKADGAVLQPGDVIATVTGPLGSLLTFERVALNFLTHLSGIATLTAAYVQAAAGTSAQIFDTRKTIPGLRGLAKYAVACGGGHSHRMGLHDAVLVKDNHIAHIATDELPAAITAMVERARKQSPPPTFVEVEVDTLAQLQAVLPTGIDVVLLDNMTPDQLRQAVALRDEAAPEVLLEASGGVNLQTVADIAATGVERIAVGALTHSAVALDIGMDIEPA